MRRIRFALALPPLLLAAACGWSVRVEPEGASRNAAAERSPADAAPSSPADRETQRLYATRCGRCHAPFPPSHATADRWPRLLRKYGPRAGLFGAERERVEAWLAERARSRNS